MLKKYRRKITACVCAIGILFSFLPCPERPAAIAAVSPAQDYIGNEVLIRFQDESGERELAGKLGTLEGIREKRFYNGYALVSFSTEKQLQKALVWLKNQKGAASWQPNYRYALTDSSPAQEPDFGLEWGLSNDGTFTAKTNYSRQTYGGLAAKADVDINAPEAWDYYSDKSKEVVVAVLDTGIDIGHAELADALWTNADEKADGKDSDGNGYVDDTNGWNFFDNSNDVTLGAKGENDHGTHVAGVIAAAANGMGISGVASNINVKIMPIKVLGGEDGLGSTSDIIQAILYAEKNGAVICNMSFGENWNDGLLGTTMQNSSMLFVTAAGNGSSYTKGKGYDIDRIPSYPSSFFLSNTLSVANVCWDGSLAVSSCYGAGTVDLAAPGSDIYSSVTGGKYAYMTGTSMAAPMVTGAAAVVYAYYGGLKASQLKDLLKATVKRLPGLDGKVITGGMVDLYAALTSGTVAGIVDKTAPTVKTSVTQGGTYQKKLTVNISDQADNLKAAWYAEGKRNKEFFTKELAGVALPVNGSSVSKTFTLSSSKTYTFYAVDKNGNETLVSKQVDIKSVKLNASSKTLKAGASFTAKGKVRPSSYSGKITYVSSNPKVAAVDKKTGRITAKRKGKAVITAKVKNGKPAVLKITVK